MDSLTNPVLFYGGLHYMFSNFSAFRVVWRGRDWMTSEHAYQAAKFLEPEMQDLIAAATSAHDAKKLGRKHDDLKRPDWPEMKLSIMEEILRAKLAQHPFIKERLLETIGREIVEDSPKDSFWGRGPDYKGANHLGRLWMKLRNELTLGKYER